MSKDKYITMAEKMLPKIKNIDWNKNDGWSKKEQVGINQTIEDVKPIIANLLLEIDKLKEENKILWKHNRQRAEEIKKLHTYGDIYKKDYHDMKDERDEIKRELAQCQDCSGYCLFLKQEIRKLKGNTGN